MYGSEKTDLLVKYYDQSIGISGEDELAWYLQKAREAGGPVLDLACGTGRLALMLAREGFEVVAIDQSVGMLNQFRNKLAEESRAVKLRIHIENQRMSAFSLDRKFNTILCCDAFFHNLTVDDEIACLEHVAQHLIPQGRFLFNLRDPTCEFLLSIAVVEVPEFKERGRYHLDDGSGTLVVEQAEVISLVDQRIRTTLRITKYNPDGIIVEKGESSWATRYLFRYEAVHLLYRCGFRLRALVGDYKNGPVKEGGQLIFDVQLNEGLAV
jgi:SAM-dependent methyltransferase